jgi:hypothetical protein
MIATALKRLCRNMVGEKRTAFSSPSPGRQDPTSRAPALTPEFLHFLRGARRGLRGPNGARRRCRSTHWVLWTEGAAGAWKLTSARAGWCRRRYVWRGPGAASATREGCALAGAAHGEARTRYACTAGAWRRCCWRCRATVSHGGGRRCSFGGRPSHVVWYRSTRIIANARLRRRSYADPGSSCAALAAARGRSRGAGMQRGIAGLNASTRCAGAASGRGAWRWGARLKAQRGGR